MSENVELYPLPAAEARPEARDFSADAMMLGVVLIWGLNFTIVKVALESFAPLALTAVRFGLATITMLVVMRLRGESLSLSRHDIPGMLFLGLSGHTIYQLLFINGLARTTPGNTSLLMGTAPIFVALYSHVLRVERISRVAWAGVILSFVGMALVILGGAGGIHFGDGAILGDLMVLAAAALWAAYTTGSKRLLARYSPLKLTGMAMLMGIPPLVLIGMPQLLSQNWGAIPLGHWGSVLYSSVLAVVVGYTVWSTSLHRVGNARTAIYSNLTPVVAILFAWVTLGTGLAPLQWLGAAVVLGGLLLTRRGRVR